MTKKRILVLLLVLGVGLFFYFKKEDISSFTKEKAPVFFHASQISENPETSKAEHTKIEVSEESPAHYANRPSPEWKSRLETSLRAQGGDSIKNIDIKKERSLVWTRDENPVHVESVVITLTNQQDEESSFRALIDSETGKVIKTWDQTVFDPANPREDFRIKLDPRYSN